MNLRAASCLLLLAAAASCNRPPAPHHITLSIPEMSTARDARIVTNAAVHEVMRTHEDRSDFLPNLTERMAIYHEGPNLLDKTYLDRLLSDLQEVGYTASIMQVGQLEPRHAVRKGHCVAWLEIPEMKDQHDANIVAASLARTRRSGHEAGILLDREHRELTIRFDPLHTAPKNIEHAVAHAGYAANDVAAFAGHADAIPHGYTPPWLR